MQRDRQRGGKVFAVSSPDLEEEVSQGIVPSHREIFQGILVFFPEKALQGAGLSVLVSEALGELARKRNNARVESGELEKIALGWFFFQTRFRIRENLVGDLEREGLEREDVS